MPGNIFRHFLQLYIIQLINPIPMKTLVVLTGPTGVGKTELSLSIAEKLKSPVISCDSRQIYKETKIGTAAPTEEQLKRVKHYFVGSKSIFEYYNAAKFEEEVINLLESLFKKSNYILMSGGSMMYIDAVCNGIDNMPDVTPEIRKELNEKYKKEGLTSIYNELKELDPEYCNKIDPKNYKRIIHALEICLMTGHPFTSFHKNEKKQRPFKIAKICINRERKELYDRIDKRVLDMIEDGLVEEAKNLYPHKALNALNTVGYKEIFNYFDGTYSLEKAIERIQFNTHKYARKQLTWFRKDKEYKWFAPEQKEEIINYIYSGLY